MNRRSFLSTLCPRIGLVVAAPSFIASVVVTRVAGHFSPTAETLFAVFIVGLIMMFAPLA